MHTSNAARKRTGSLAKVEVRMTASETFTLALGLTLTLLATVQAIAVPL